MFGLGTPWLVAAAVGGGLILFGVGTLLFQAGCALADVPERGYFRSFPIYSLTLLVCLPLAGLLVWFAGRYDAGTADGLGAARIAALVVSVFLSWLLSAGIYALLLAASVRKSLIVAGVELLLMALLSALLAAVVLVVLALVQIASRPPPVKPGEPLPSAARAAPALPT